MIFHHFITFILNFFKSIQIVAFVYPVQKLKHRGSFPAIKSLLKKCIIQNLKNMLPFSHAFNEF